MIIPEKYIGETKKKKVTIEMIKKDLALSYILYEMSEHIKQNKNSPFSKLIFKGGTLLSKTFLECNRLSEDLDFTFSDNKEINKTTKNQKKQFIKGYLKQEFLPEMQKIANKYSFDFDSDEINKQEQNKYCPKKGATTYTRFNLYLDKQDQTPIKIEINFLEELFDEPRTISLKHLNPNSESLIFPLKDTTLLSYSPEEILVEKIRAILTRQGRIHERDLFDLFLLEKIGHNYKHQSEERIKQKIRQGIGFLEDKNKELEKIGLIKEKFLTLEKEIGEEIDTMNLREYDLEEYKIFFQEIKEFLIKLDFSDL